MSTTAIVYEKNLMDTTSRRDGTVVNKFTTGNIGDEAQAIFDNLFSKNGYNTETHGMDIIDDPDDGTTNEFERIFLLLKHFEEETLQKCLKYVSFCVFAWGEAKTS